MRFVGIIFFLLCSAISLQAQESLNLSKKIRLEHKRYVLGDLLEELRTKHKINFSYSSSTLDDKTNIKFQAYNQKIKDILDKIAHTNDITYLEYNQKILFKTKPPTVEKYWIYGYIKEEHSGEALIGALLYNQIENTYAHTNEFGYYSMRISRKNPIIEVSYLGYKTQQIQLSTERKKRLDISMSSDNIMPEVIVIAEEKDEDKPLIGQHIVDKQLQNDINEDIDPLSSLKHLPGIQSGSELQGNLFVRGGGSDQNLMLMDGVPIYEVSHLLGLSSIFNADVINKVEVSSGGFDSKYGGRLSSIINLKIKNGNKFKHKAKITLGILGTKLHLEGPLKKEKTSYLVSARTSLLNNITRPLAKKILALDNSDFEYQDLNAKIHHRLSERTSLFISTFQGFDLIGFTNSTFDNNQNRTTRNTYEVLWRNRIYTIGLDRMINKKLYLNITGSIVHYKLDSRSSKYLYTADSTSNTELDLLASSTIHDLNLRADWEYSFSNKHRTNFGFGWTNHMYNPSVVTKFTIDKIIQPSEKSLIKATERFAYWEDQYDITPTFQLSLGIHAAQFLVEEETFNSIQPRFRLNFNLGKHHALHVSGSQMEQFVHLLINPGTGLPSDLWLPSTKKIPPERSNQLTSTYLYRNKNYIFQASLYYKSFSNLIEYQSIFPLYNPIINKKSVIPIEFETRDWEDRVEIGTGKAYGIDFYTAYNSKKWQNSIKYSYGHSNRKFANLNKGKSFPFKYDRRHDFNISIQYNFNKKWNTGINWVYGSGHAISFADTQYLSSEGDYILDIGSRNGKRLPAYHRLDIRSAYKHDLSQRTKLSVIFGTYNLYNRLNPYFVYVLEDSEQNLQARQVGVFPILPYVNVRLEF